AVGHQRVVTFERRGLVGIVGGVVTVVPDEQLVLVRDRRNALGHGECGACGDPLDTESFGHGEAILDVVVGHVVLHVVTEQLDIDTGVVEFGAALFPGVGAGGFSPIDELRLGGAPFFLLLGSELEATAATSSFGGWLT